MKKYKNIFLSCLVILLSLVLVGCSKTYTVNFIDYDGTILKTEEVKEGGAATAPANPTHSEYEFITWSVDFSVITEDLDVKAVYLGTPISSQYKMDFSYSGKEFKKDGVGEVELNRVVDGDTISVRSGGDFEAAA